MMDLGRCSVLQTAAMRPARAFLAHPRTIRCFTLLVALLWATAATAQTSTPITPTVVSTFTKEASPSSAFATKSLNALTSLPTVSGARWMEVARKNPKAIMAAIESAERRGWRPTSSTAHTVRGAAKPGLRPVSVQEHHRSGNGEMLVWDWDDGNDLTGEGTVWVRSFRTGNEMTYNIQLWGQSYDQIEVIFEEGLSATMTDTGLIGVATPLFTPGGPQFTRVAMGQQYVPAYGCAREGREAGARCNLRNAGRYLRQGLRGVAADLGIAGAAEGVAIFRPRLAAAMRGVSTGALGGASIAGSFAAGVLEEAIWGTDNWQCVQEAQQAKQLCEDRLAECRRERRADCY